MPASDRSATARRQLVNFKATAAEREQLRQFAAAQGTTLSDLIRRGLQLQGLEQFAP
jgi:hypothetical protein